MAKGAIGGKAPETAPRRYDNRRRAEKAVQTRTAILMALAKQLTASNSGQFSVEAAARDAGVTTRTVFRYFPTKDAMLDALAEWVLGITEQVPLPKSAADVADVVDASYRMFEQHATLMQALLLSELGRGVRSRLTQRRRKGIASALKKSAQHLPPADDKAVRALITHLMTAETWLELRNAYHVHGAEGARAVTWLVTLAIAALESGATLDDTGAG